VTLDTINGEFLRCMGNENMNSTS